MPTLLEQFTTKNMHKDSSIPFLIEESIRLKIGKLGPNGELVIKTGKHTGRSADDKYVVLNSESSDQVWWENNVNKMEQSSFDQLHTDVLNYLNDGRTVYHSKRSIGHADHYSLGVELVTTEPNAIIFSYYMFKNQNENNSGEYKILHAPNFFLDPAKYKTKSSTVIVTCFKSKTTIIIGTLYSGEIKKSMFSIMNFLLPKINILPMHSGACLNDKNESFVFFGLSGTGKTTLSTDEGTFLIGDDEHGLSDKGIFNFENGCYAKTMKLGLETEPAIFTASTQFASYLENVALSDDQKSIDFFDGSLTENGRSSYPLNFIKDRVPSGEGKIPKHIFFLTADAFGVLPAISRLNQKEAKKYFVLGYTAKLAGTEIGIKTPKAAFSPCFGAPFMLLHPSVYANLLSQYMEKYGMNVWLINTGWNGGGYGEGSRFPLKITRELIRAVSNGELTNANFVKDEIFNLEIPTKVRSMNEEILIPSRSWKNQTKYNEEAIKLRDKFETEIKKFRLD